MNSRPRAAYVHVPFCVHRCGYCDFTVVAGRDDLMDEFLLRLEDDLRLGLNEPAVVDTLFVGGGTPSYLPAPQLKTLMQMLWRWLPVNPGGEFTVECNPDQFTPDRMDVLAEGGVNRISLGSQSFDPGVLALLERRHAPQTTARVVAALRERGLTNISLDLIYGVPGQSLSQWEETLRAACDLAPPHVSTYGLTYEKGTAFWSRRHRGTLQPVEEELEREMYLAAMSMLEKEGLRQYELSNYAIPGAECRHNQVYWNAAPYFGFGPGAAAYIDGIRTTNHRSLSTWLKRLSHGESPVAEREALSPDLKSREAVMLGLRQIAGISNEEYRSRYGREIRDLNPIAYERFLGSGWLEEKNGRLRLTREGRLMADTVVAEFL